jgi:hypothetical protein
MNLAQVLLPGNFPRSISLSCSCVKRNEIMNVITSPQLDETDVHTPPTPIRLSYKRENRSETFSECDLCYTLQPVFPGMNGTHKAPLRITTCTRSSQRPNTVAIMQKKLSRTGLICKSGPITGYFLRRS